MTKKKKNSTNICDSISLRDINNLLNIGRYLPYDTIREEEYYLMVLVCRNMPIIISKAAILKKKFTFEKIY